MVTFSCATEGAVISYSLDNDGVWTEGNTFTVTEAVSVQVKAVLGEAESEIAVFTYTVKAEEPAPAQDLEKTIIPESLELKPLDNDAYWRAVQAEAQGLTTKSGIPILRWYIKTTHAGEKEIEQFKLDVQDYKAAVLNK